MLRHAASTRWSIVVLSLVFLGGYAIKDTSNPALVDLTVEASTEALVEQEGGLAYTPDPDWVMKQFPDGIGHTSGNIAVSANGEVYVSVGVAANSDRSAPPVMDPRVGLQVFTQDGIYLRNVPNAPPDLHDFFIREESDGEGGTSEVLYGVRLVAQARTPNWEEVDEIVVKMTLDGEQLLSIPGSDIPDQYKLTDNDGNPRLAIAAVTVAPSTEDLYVSDGYASDYVHIFDQTGKYISSFGGKEAPYNFHTLHNLAIDTRFSPERIIGNVRDDGRVVHLGLDGEFLGVIVEGFVRPGALCMYGDYAVVGEFGSRMTLLDKMGTVVTEFGINRVFEETTGKIEHGGHATPPARWRDGETTSPHGVAVNDRGDVFVVDWSLFGRVHRFNRQ